MELECVHEHITELHRLYGEQAFISLAEAARYIGCAPEQLKRDKTFPMKEFSNGDKRSSYRVPIINLARWCCS